MGATDIVFYIVILIMSVVIHEISHGFVAEKFGDKTARLAGRLTLNPLRHLDLFGSVLLPALLVISNTGIIFGWAKPVPYNPDNLSNKRWGTLAVAAAGILANLFIATLFGLVLRFTAASNFSEGFYFMTSAIVLVNIALAVFNLLPIPPLDGSKILFSFLPSSWAPVLAFLEQYSFFLIVVFIIFFPGSLYPIMAYLFQLITGLPI